MGRSKANVLKGESSIMGVLNQSSVQALIAILILIEKFDRHTYNEYPLSQRPRNPHNHLPLVLSWVPLSFWVLRDMGPSPFGRANTPSRRQILI